MPHGTDADAVAELIERCHRLGADPTTTNYAGGNASCKTDATDPVTGTPVELLYVKGSGGDLGTLTEAGLAVLRLDRLRALADVYPGVEREDEMVAAFDFCLHGKAGAAPSIDTAMHGLVDDAHVDHLHPDAGIAFATAVDGESLTKECYGDSVAWVPWRRPGFQLGLDIAAIRRANPQSIGVILGGHGITAWGPTSDECERNSLDMIGRAKEYIARPRQRGAVRPGRGRLRAVARRGAPLTGGGPGTGDPRARVNRQAAGRPLRRQPRRTRLPRPRRASAAGGAGDLVP
jgi:rhamnose utilization protein RhaD (predicted bifunctional aldolase and dehydrogenase)